MKECYVYFIKASTGGSNYPVKIGVAYDPAKRLDELKTGNPFKLSIMSCVKMPSRKAAYDLEAFLHRHFDKKRMEGEWFRSKGVNLADAFERYAKMSGRGVKFYNGDIGQSKSSKSSEIERLTKLNEQLMNTIESLQNDIDEYLDKGLVDTIV